MSTHTYQDIADNDGIRLLILEPGDENAELSCRLAHARLSENPDYDAISYTWGADALTHHILLDGQAFPVRENIFHALVSYRDRERPRTLWADAICINQGNIPERSSQVKLMKKVYATAKAVLIWLGPG
ncbi:heterokaryon incompatibility protein-domain-containing protein, partial [Massariosphaeria phaeospora]